MLAFGLLLLFVVVAVAVDVVAATVAAFAVSSTVSNMGIAFGTTANPLAVVAPTVPSTLTWHTY